MSSLNPRPKPGTEVHDICQHAPLLSKASTNQHLRLMNALEPFAASLASQRLTTHKQVPCHFAGDLPEAACVEKHELSLNIGIIRSTPDSSRTTSRHETGAFALHSSAWGMNLQPSAARMS